MTIKKLLKKLSRPADTIIVRGEGNHPNDAFDGHNFECMPEDLFRMKVKGFEINPVVEKVSTSELIISFVLYITV